MHAADAQKSPLGKTILTKKLSEELKHLHPAGFYTAEIREARQRRGYHLIIIDEIGKMECLSDPFKNLLKKFSILGHWSLQPVALKGNGVIQEIKERQDMNLFEMTSHISNALHLFSFQSPCSLNLTS